MLDPVWVAGMGKTHAETRPNYQHSKTRLHAGDALIVSGLDRLGRGASDTITALRLGIISDKVLRLSEMAEDGMAASLIRKAA